MKDCVLIKGNQHGLSVFINEESTIDQIKLELTDKLKSARNFFGANKVTLSYSGKTLSDHEQDELLDIFTENSDLDILCVVDESNDVIDVRETISQEVREEVIESVTKEVESKYNKDINQLQSEIDSLKSENLKLNDRITNISNTKERTLSLQEEDKVTFHNATLRSGQQVIVNHSVIIMGDINNGARVEAGGNVIVLGKLKGVVHAGLKGSDSSYIIALDMNPVQLRINNAFGRASDGTRMAGSSIEPKIAFMHDGMIAIETIDSKVLKEIRERS